MNMKYAFCLLLTAILITGCGGEAEPSQLTDSKSAGSESTSSKPNGSESDDSESTDSSAAQSEGSSTNSSDSRPIDVTFDDVQLEIEADTVYEESMLTDRVKELEGKRIRIRGFILAESTYKRRNIRQFVLIKNTECKYGAGGEFHHVIAVTLNPEDAVDYTLRPVTVEGKLKLQPWTGPNGNTLGIYHLEG